MIVSLLHDQNIHSLIVSPSLTLADLKTLAQFETGCKEVDLWAHGKLLTGPQRTLTELAVQDQDVVTVKDKQRAPSWLDPEVQVKIEQAIHVEAIESNLQRAMDLHPESFSPVSMLYIRLRVEGVEVKAFVDCGAQATFMTLKCAERCR